MGAYLGHYGILCRSVLNNYIVSDSSASTVIKEFEQEEYYINTHFDSVLDSVKLFADDELLSKPGMYISDIVTFEL